MMQTREVRRLRLRLADESSAQRARIAIEDGLATADFGDYGRLILVRHLALPGFAGDITGPAAARAIEVAFRALLPDAVHAFEPHAAAARVVWFANRLEALVEALSLRAEGRALDGWFWRKVDPLLSEPTPDIAAMFGAIVALGDESSGPDVVIRALVHRWHSWTDGAFRRFLEAVPERLLLDLTEDTAESQGATHIYRDEEPVRPTPAVRQRVAMAAQVRRQKARWVAYCELVALDVLNAESPRLARAAAVNALVEESVLVTVAKHETTVSVHRPSSAGDEPEISVEPRRVSLREQTVSAPRMISRALRDPPAPSLDLPPWLVGACTSTHAGFFMLLNAWRAVGFQAWIEAHPRPLQSAICKAWLERWSARFDMSDDDPQRAVWRSLPEAATSIELAEWMTGTRRWLRTRARIGPASLVLRAGAVAITPTHIDVVFRMNEIDLRVRRAGLDQDPGWIAWLGRIVGFHYVAE